MNERTHTENTQPLYTRVVRYSVKRIQQIVNLYLVKEADFSLLSTFITGSWSFTNSTKWSVTKYSTACVPCLVLPAFQRPGDSAKELHVLFTVMGFPSLAVLWS